MKAVFTLFWVCRPCFTSDAKQQIEPDCVTQQQLKASTPFETTLVNAQQQQDTQALMVAAKSPQVDTLFLCIIQSTTTVPVPKESLIQTAPLSPAVCG